MDNKPSGVAGPIQMLQSQWGHLGRFSSSHPHYKPVPPPKPKLQQQALAAASNDPSAPLTPTPPTGPKSELLAADPIQAKVFRLERNLKFLKEQHSVVLSGLQEEVESLKRKNKELQYKLITGKETETPEESSAASSKEAATPTAAQLEEAARCRQLEQEVRVLRATLQNVRDRNLYLTFLVDQLRCQRASEVVAVHQAQQADQHAAALALRIQEYEETVFNLRRDNESQRQQINHLKAELHQILNGSASSGQHAHRQQQQSAGQVLWYQHPGGPSRAVSHPRSAGPSTHLQLDSSGQLLPRIPAAPQHNKPQQQLNRPRTGGANKKPQGLEFPAIPSAATRLVRNFVGSLPVLPRSSDPPDA